MRGMEKRAKSIKSATAPLMRFESVGDKKGRGKGKEEEEVLLINFFFQRK